METCVKIGEVWECCNWNWENTMAYSIQNKVMITNMDADSWEWVYYAPVDNLKNEHVSKRDNFLKTFKKVYK